MPAASISLVPSSTSDGLFQAWATAISTQLAAMGLVKTADSGQVNTATMSAPGSGSTYVGFEIWRFDDALQSTAPVFIKLEYGSGLSATYPGIAFRLGSGTDGAGNLTGALSLRQVLECSSNNANAQNCFFAGGNNRISIAMWAQGPNVSSGFAMQLSIERTVDEDGDPTGEGVMCIWYNPSAGQNKMVAWSCTTGAMSSVETGLTCFGPSVGTGSSGSQTSVFPIFHSKGVLLPPGLNLLGCFAANFSPNVQTTITFYGAPHNYICLDPAITGSPVQRIPTTGTLLMRFE